MKLKNLSALFTFALLLGACSSGPSNHTQGIYMLIDTSGTYTKEVDKAQQVINYTLAKLQSNDTFVVASINTGSFSEKNIIAKMTLDDRPSKANQQKRLFKQNIDDYVTKIKSSSYTDISGGILQATDYLTEKDNGKKTIFIFSDLKEELKKGYVRDIPFNLKGVRVVALNVTKLKSDNIDPREYMDRVTLWSKKVESSGGSWLIINDLEHLNKILVQD
ncbi:MAG: hypothetical protein OEW60_03885 [Thiovulaceae bacterium]|nr:hypothetical protein [Sulfurimonadaceae bacterium]